MTRKASHNPESSAQMGLWQSGLSAAMVYAAGNSLSFMRASRYGLFFVMTVPEEDNIQTLMFRSHMGALTRLSPVGVNVRSRVHEYGCLPYAFSDDRVFYCDFHHSHLLVQGFDQQTGALADALPLTQTQSANNTERYGDLLFDPHRQRLICIREQHMASGAVSNHLVAISTETGASVSVIFNEADFVASPALSPDGRYLVFISWNHPNMPWDQTQLQVATLDGEGNCAAPLSVRHLQQTGPAAIVQPAFSPSGDLFFISDWSDWWNLYRIPAHVLQQTHEPASVIPVSSAEHIAAEQADICGPLWQPGAVNYTFPDHSTVLFTLVRDCWWSIKSCKLSPDPAGPATHPTTSVIEGFGALDSLQALPAVAQIENAIMFAVIASPVTTAPLILSVADTLVSSTLYPTPAIPVEASIALSAPHHIRYPTAQGLEAYGLYYAPCNALYNATDLPPPLLVMVHGGPTSSARSACNLMVQFWTQRGFAVFDVNHRGSTGYGRRFRQSLYGHWGEHDIDDVLAGVYYLIREGLADADKVAIRGGSAGGFTVLAALAASELFAAGTSYYGISDLAMLARDTHKFESHYLEQLIGPWPQASHIYAARSPINNINSIRAPVLMLQGKLDKIVPPNQAQAIFAQLKHNNPASELIYFDDEAHGFRKPVNQTEALERELAFYQSVLL